MMDAMAQRTSRVDRLATLVLAVLMAVVASVSVAGRPSTPDKCTREGHHCGQSLIACCCVGPQDGSVPTTMPSSRVQPTGPEISIDFVPGSPVILSDCELAKTTALRLHSPPHGFRFVELPILHSTFLI